MKKFKLGQRVRCDYTIERVGEQVSKRLLLNHHYKEREVIFFTWREVKLAKSVIGIYCGYRYKQVGYRDFAYEGYPYFCSTDKSIKVALVAVDERKNPVLVPYEKLEEENEHEK